MPQFEPIGAESASVRRRDGVRIALMIGNRMPAALSSCFSLCPRQSLMSPHGKEPEFVRLLTRHSSQIFGFILMLSVNRSDAEDVLQDTSVVLWEKFDTYQTGTSFQAWACRIAYYEVLGRRRNERKVRYFSDKAIALLANDALSFMEQSNADKDALADCLDKLTEKDRRLIEQKYFVQLTTTEIAERSSRSIHAIYRALSRVHGLLLRCIRKTLESR